MKICARPTAVAVACLFALCWFIISKMSRQSSAVIHDELSENHPRSDAALQPVGTGGTMSQASAIRSGDQNVNPTNASAMIVPKPVFSPTLRRLLERPNVCLRPDELRKLTPEEVNRIIVEYEKISDPTKKRGLVWALGFSVSGAAVDTLLKAVTTEYSGRELDVKQAGSAHLAFSMLGVQGEHSQSALDFLVAGTRVDYWNGKEPWLLEPALAENVHWRLAGSCISALGTSGNDLAFKAVTTIRESDSQLYQGKVASSLMSARFYATMRRDYGSDFLFNEICFDGSIMMSAYRVWKYTTEEGRAWSRWANDVTQVPSVESSPTDAQLAAFNAAVARWRPPTTP